jgi:hypothetical protein
VFEVNWKSQLSKNFLPVLHFNHCLTTKHSEKTAHLSATSILTTKSMYHSVSAPRLSERTVHVFISGYLLHISVFVTLSSGRPQRSVLKNYTLFVILLNRFPLKCNVYPVFLIYNVTLLNTICISSFCTSKILVKILNCSTLISLGSCLLLCILASICVHYTQLCLGAECYRDLERTTFKISFKIAL